MVVCTSCNNGPSFPKTIPSTGKFDADFELVHKLNITGILGGSYYLEDGWTEEYGQTLICEPEKGQYTVAFYKPIDSGYALIGKPVSFTEKHPFGTVHKECNAMKGFYKNKTRIAYVDRGQLIIEDE